MRSSQSSLSDLSNAARYRAQAADLIRFAERTRSDGARRNYVRLAWEYERLAATCERRYA